MRSTDFRSIVEPILNEAFDGVYDQRADEWKQVFVQQQGIPRNYHEEPVLYGFGAAPELPDGTAVTYQAGGVLFLQRYVYKVYGLAFALTAQSLIETKETLCANVLNRAFTAGYVGGDGVTLVANNHPIAAGTFSNQLTTPANLSQTSLEQILIQIRNAVDNNGKRIRLNPEKLVVSPSNVFQAEVLLKSVLRTGTADNDINPVKSMGLLAGGQANLSRLTSTTAWWVKTDAPEGLKLMMRRGLEKSMEGDFETDSTRFKSTERYAVGWTDPRTVYGTAGV
jgi:hypothetical protein